jgi:hypothetical protein
MTGSIRAQPQNTINIKGNVPLSAIQLKKLSFASISLPYSFNSNICSFFVSTVIEDILADLPMLEQPVTCSNRVPPGRSFQGFLLEPPTKSVRLVLNRTDRCGQPIRPIEAIFQQI